MYRSNYRYGMQLWNEPDRRASIAAPIEPDFVPASEAVIFDALRDGDLSAANCACDIEPIFAPQVGPDRIRGIRAVIRHDDNGHNIAAEREFPLEYFAPLAQDASPGLVERKLLKKGQTFFYGLSAHARDDDDVAETGDNGGMDIEEIDPPLPLVQRDLRRMLHDSFLVGVPEQDPPLFIRWRVLQEAAQMARDAGANEAAGILAGHLCHDPSVPEAFVVVTALLPADCAAPELTRFRFTPEIWIAAQKQLLRRGRDEIMVGWVHSHSFYYTSCKDCSRAGAKTCGAATPFLSAEDCHLHRLVFPRAFSIALLVNDAPCTGLSISAFGWRNGKVSSRAYHVLQPPILGALRHGGDEKEDQ